MNPLIKLRKKRERNQAINSTRAVSSTTTSTLRIEESRRVPSTIAKYLLLLE